MSFSVVSDGMRRTLTVSERYFPFSSFNEANGVKKTPGSGDMMISGLSMRSKIGAIKAAYNLTISERLV